jgi:hypothetical protein
MLNYVLLKMAIMDFQTTPKQTNKQKQTPHILYTTENQYLFLMALNNLIFFIIMYWEYN